MTAIRKYASPWAYLVYVCLLVGGLYAATLWYRERLRTKNRLQMAVIFTNITHECSHRSPELLQVMSSLLSPYFNVKTATNGERAQHIIEKTALDIACGC